MAAVYNKVVRRHFFASEHVNGEHPLWGNDNCHSGHAQSAAHNDAVAFVLSTDRQQLVAKVTGSPYLVALADLICATYRQTQQFDLDATTLDIPTERQYVTLLAEQALQSLQPDSE